MEANLVIVTIIGMAVVTYLPRLLPLIMLSGKKIPEAVLLWLEHVAPAVLAAMLLPTLIIRDGSISFGIENLFLWAAIPTLVAAILSKSLFIPVVFGMVLVILGRWLLGPV